MKELTIKEAKDLLNSAKRTQGQFFGVYFSTREDGEDKVINGKAGVREGIKGVGKRYRDVLQGLVTVWARNREDFRSIPIEKIDKITMDGEVYEVNPSKETILTGLGIQPLFDWEQSY